MNNNVLDPHPNPQSITHGDGSQCLHSNANPLRRNFLGLYYEPASDPYFKGAGR